MKSFIATDPNNQAVLDRSDDAYIAVAPEYNNGQYGDRDQMFMALMLAWEYIALTSTEAN